MPKRTASGLVATYWPVAVGVAGAIWATVAFLLKDAPLLATRTSGSAELTWSDTSSPEMCRANFAVVPQNSGTTGISVSKVRVRAWLIDASASTDAKAAYFDALSLLNKTEPITDVVYGPAYTRDARAVPPPLVARYYAGMQYHHNFEWDIPRREQRRFYVYAELFLRSSDTETDWYFSAWSRACEAPHPRGSERAP
jgi:hypothetical protein